MRTWCDTFLILKCVMFYLLFHKMILIQTCYEHNLWYNHDMNMIGKHTISYDRDMNMRFKWYEVIWRERRTALYHGFEGCVWNLTKCRRVGLITHMCGCRNVCLATCIACIAGMCARVRFGHNVFKGAFILVSHILRWEHTYTRHCRQITGSFLCLLPVLFASHKSSKQAKPESTHVPITHLPPSHLFHL